MTPDQTLFNDDTIRACLQSCLRSVGILADSLIAWLVRSPLFPCFQFRWHVLAELLVRKWLYVKESQQIETGLAAVKVNKEFKEIMVEFHERLAPLRSNPQQSQTDTEARDNAFQFDHLTPALEEFWSYVRERVCSFLDCAGIIPLVINDTEAVAVPFKLKRQTFKFTFTDAESLPVDGWISEAKALWESLGERLGIVLSVHLRP
jgi:hypothetical protein